MRAKAERIANRQALVCLELSQTILKSSKEYPADRTLARLFRKHRELGSRDRRIIQQVIFSMFRWWGWVLHWEKSSWPTVLLLAYLLDGNPWNALCDVWVKDSLTPQLPEGWSISGDLEKKQQWLVGYIQKKISLFPLEELFPKFFIESGFIHMDCQTKSFQISLLNSLQNRALLWIRLRASENQELDKEFQNHQVTTISHENVPQAVELRGSINVNNLIQFKKGAFEVQDLASQCIGWICSPNPGEYWWDVCAGGGGKSLHLASLMKGKGEVLSTEVRVPMIKEIRRRAQRGGFSNIRARYWDGKRINETKQFDGVLVDAPCSGTGTWRRNPDARWRTDIEEVEAKAELQLRILERVKNYVKREGVLIYATCSIMQIENEDVVTNFLERNSNFKLDPTSHPITARTTPGMITFWPHQFNSDGMFVARMRCV